MCLVPNCQGSVYSKSYCRYHYERNRLGKSLDVVKRSWVHGGSDCTQDGCDKKAKAKGLCDFHYKRRRAGLPLDMPFRHVPQFVCTYDQCEEPCGPSMLCPLHWKRVWTRTHGASRRAMKRAAFVEHVDIAQLAIRDDECCGLCGGHVDRSLSWPHPQSQSIDHVVPLSRGGEHSYRNTQLAHVSCNASKRNRTSETEKAA